MNDPGVIFSDSDQPVSDSERNWAIAMHLSLLSVHVVAVLWVVVPIILWLAKRKESAFLDDHGRETVNFHLSLLLYSGLVTVVTIMTCGAGALLFIPLYALGIAGMIMASVSASKGQYYRYPMCLRMIH